MGSDARVVDSARVSFKKLAENYTEEQNEKLLRYLAKHNHWTPFSHPQITIHEKVPIFVARQRFKHMVGFTYNEVSRRYVNDDPEFYYPDEWRTKPQGSIKQGSGTEKLPEPVFNTRECKNCSASINLIYRPQGGGRSQIYCSDKCKYDYYNRNRNPYKHIWNNAKSRAKSEGKEWSINFDTFDFPSHCPILKIELDYSIGKGKIQDNSPSFDRIDHTKDYVPGNVRLLSNKANTMKSNASNEELITFAKSVLLSQGYIVDLNLSYHGIIEKAKNLYKNMIKEGYAPEMARSILPQSMYTEYYVTGSLAAWARAYKQRIDAHAQKEIQDLAVQWDEIIRPLYPVSWSVLVGNSLV